jgi:hypothetical protein
MSSPSGVAGELLGTHSSDNIRENPATHVGQTPLVMPPKRATHVLPPCIRRDGVVGLVVGSLAPIGEHQSHADGKKGKPTQYSIEKHSKHK